MPIKFIIITGPTATGKTSLGVNIALNFNGEIISADSRQVYIGLDIGTGKDLSEYSKEGQHIPYHLIDTIDPKEVYNLRQFNYDALRKIKEISDNNKLPIMVGGTPLYIDSIISKYKFPLPPPDHFLRQNIKDKSAEEIASYLKEYHLEHYNQLENKLSRPRLVRLLEEIELKNRSQTYFQSLDLEYDFLILAPFYDRKEVHNRIEQRLDERLKNGMVEEVDKLHSQGVSWEKLDSFGLEYRYITQFLLHELSYSEMRNALLAKIRQFARRQDVWFRKMEKEGHNIYWLPKGDLSEASELINFFLTDIAMPLPKIKISEIYYGKK